MNQNSPKMVQLNPEQTEAAHHIEGPMIVLAGPGTGKTQIIASRIAHLLEETQMSPHNILALTFTEAGVVSMRQRLLSQIGTAAYYVRIHTFHSFCNEVIKDFPERFMMTKELEALTDIERVQLFRDLLKQMPTGGPITPFGNPYLYQSDLIRAIQQLKREDVTPDQLKALIQKLQEFSQAKSEQIEAFISIHGSKLTDQDVHHAQNWIAESPLDYLLVDHSGPLEKKERTAFKNAVKKEWEKLESQLPKQEALLELYMAYQDELKRRSRYDYEDMILFVVNAFKEDKALLAHYQEQFQYILVDEYQDTNGAQNEVVQLIAEYFESPNLFVVGDDKQSIYRFQGASLENILYFYKLYKEDIKLVSLKSNYRSQQTILDAAHALIVHNQHSLAQSLPELSQELTAKSGIQEAPLKLASYKTASSERYGVVKSIQSLIESGVQPSEIAVLFRNNRDAEELVDLMQRLAIPFRLELGEDILKDAQIHQILQLMSLVNNPSDEHLLFYVLHFEFLGFRAIDIYKALRAAKKERVSFSEYLESKEPFSEFMHRLYQWKSLSINRPLSEAFEHVIKEAGYLDHILKKVDKLEHLNRLNSLFDELKQLNRAKHDLSLESWLDSIQLHLENDIPLLSAELKTRENGVRLMTAHKSKGREFEHVFIIHCVDKHWGNKSSRERIQLPVGILETETQSSAEKRNEDERRLFYVALTRAKKTVTLTYAETSESGRPQVPAIFLSEIPEDYLERINTDAVEEEATQRLQTLFLSPPAKDHHEEEAAFVKQLLENYTLSVTHLNHYLRCPRLFYYQHILRVPGAKNKFSAFGSAVHEALHDLTLEFKEKPQQGTPSLNYLLKRFDHHLKNEVLMPEDFAACEQFGHETLRGYYAKYHDEFNPNGIPEYDFSSHGVHVDGIPITGKLDRVQFLDDEKKTVHVVDYKTGNPDTKNRELKKDGDYRRQIVFYQLLCDLSPKFPYEMKSGEIDFVQAGTKSQNYRREVIHVSDEEKASLKSLIKEVYEEIMNLEFLHSDEWSTCGECEYCQFFNQSESPL